MTEPVCLSCGKPADVKIDPVFRPLTARGERACEQVAKAGVTVQYACLDCLTKIGEAVDGGVFADEDP